MSVHRTFSTTEAQRRLTELLCSGLEAWIHQILYKKKVYPQDTFQNSTFQGIRLYLNRHPGVVSYISEAVKVAAPSLACGAAQSCALVITERRDVDDSLTELETYSLNFKGTDKLSAPGASILSSRMIDKLETGFRDLLLSVSSLETKRPTTSDSISFFVKVHIPQANKTCSALNTAFAAGDWGNADAIDPAMAPSRGYVVRPMHHFNEENSGVSVQFFIKRPAQKRKRLVETDNNGQGAHDELGT